MSKTVNIHAAKTQLSKLIQRVCRGEEVVIANHGRPVARLVPVLPDKKRVPGMMKGLAVPESFFDRISAEELKAWDGGQ